MLCIIWHFLIVYVINVEGFNMRREVNKEIQELDNLVARNIKMRRKMLGLSQSNLGEHLEVSVQQVQKYEYCKNRVSSGKLYKIAQLLKAPIECFFKNKPIWLNKPNE